MNNNQEGLPPARWQGTVTSIKCEHVGEETRIFVNKEWKTICSWCVKYEKVTASKDKKNRIKKEKCKGPLCEYMIEFRDILIEEEQRNT